jgi:urea transporter/murein DD-endopeptidase MepM/ murein hydrolase activator NlpD
LNTKRLHIFGKGFINSYSQLFFADSKVFAWLLLLSSFVNPITGISGIIATLVALLFAYWIGLDRPHISYGTYSYNALMIGMVLGAQYSFNWNFVLLLITGSILSVLFAVWFNTILYKYKLPALSLSFLVSLWLILIGMRTFGKMELSEAGLFRLNDWYAVGGNQLVQWMQLIEENQLPEFVEVYLKSLSAVFFQYNIISGTLILVGLIIWSRIAFVLSVVGFVIGYLFYLGVSGEFSQLYYSYIGFNFILTAISLGGYYLIPSRASFVLAIIAMPLIGIFISGLNGLMGVFQLPLYSLPFSITVILILMLLQQRKHFHRLVLVTQQHFSPEKNLYQFTNEQTRFRQATSVKIRLPFYGEWHVSQGYNGNITHRENWRQALDFVVVDDLLKTYKSPGEKVTDYYCYNLPVLAPADGYVSEVIDGIEDNSIGEVDTTHNWGNTIVINHGEGIYSKLSHLYQHTLVVRKNDYVKAGQVIAHCGSSGRSPEPHLHFQMQATPYIGSATMSYPIAYFISRIKEQYAFHEFDIPKEGAHVHHPIQTTLIYDAFQFIPGKKITYEIENAQKVKSLVTWECGVNAWNQTYLHCAKSDSYAYFVSNETVFYFTAFYGDKKAFLFDFYLAAQKILLGYYQDLIIHDSIAATVCHDQWALWIQDAIAPFYQFMKVNYQSKFSNIDNVYAPTHIVINTKVSAFIANHLIKQRVYSLTINNGVLAEWSVKKGNKTVIKATCIDL